MALFVVESKHPAETCPAGHPEMGPALVRHMSAESAATFGVKLHGDAVVDGAHTFYLILDAKSEEQVKAFMAPFYQVGVIEIMPASSCEQVVRELPADGGERLLRPERRVRASPPLRRLVIDLVARWLALPYHQQRPLVPATNNRTEQAIGKSKVRFKTVRVSKGSGRPEPANSDSYSLPDYVARRGFSVGFCTGSGSSCARAKSQPHQI